MDEISGFKLSPRGGVESARGGQGEAQMVFPGAGPADEDGIALGVEEGAGGEFANLSFIDRRIGEDELVEIFEDGELGAADAIADRACLPVGAFGSDQAGDERISLIAPGKAFTSKPVE